jgi:peptidylprolyl isomerase
VPRSLRTFLFVFVGLLTLSVDAGAQAPSTSTVRDPENTLFLDLKDGRVVILLRPDLAPKHVARIKELTRQHFYDGLLFHRVIDGFMAQTGDPKGNGTGGSGQKIPAEFSREPFVRGTVGAARAQDPNSADSQFFIMFAPTPSLNGAYTVWGRVISGMEFVDKIKKGEPPRDPDRIVKLQVAADVK